MVEAIAMFVIGAVVFGWLMALTLTALEARDETRRDKAQVYGALAKLQEQRERPSSQRVPRVEIVSVPLPGVEAAKPRLLPSTPQPVAVTRDDDPIYTRPTVVAPAPTTIPAPPPDFEDRESSEDLTEVWCGAGRPVQNPGQGGRPGPGGKASGVVTAGARTLSEAS